MSKTILQTEKFSVRKIILVCCIGLFVLSLFNRAFCSEDGDRSSVLVLLSGWITMFPGRENLCWLANPCLIIGWILIIKKKKYAWAFALAASFWAIYFLTYSSVFEKEPEHYPEIVELYIGYWLWLSNCIATFFGSILLRVADKK